MRRGSTPATLRPSLVWRPTPKHRSSAATISRSAVC